MNSFGFIQGLRMKLCSLVFFSIVQGCWIDDSTYQTRLLELTDQDGDGFTPNDGDCDDGDPMLHPDADEVCDEIDNDCNGLLDDDPVSGTLYYIEDTSGCFNQAVLSCDPPEGVFTLEPEEC